MSFDLGSLLSQFVGGGPIAGAPGHFDRVAQNASPDLLTQGLAAMFHSDQTPPFAEMAAHLFGQANPSQQAAILNQLLGSMGPTVLASLMNGTGGRALSEVLGQLNRASGSAAAVTPEQASKLTPEQLQQIASHAEQYIPGIVDQMSGFFAEHPGLIRTLGGAALSIALSRMAVMHQAQ
jgi:hypothetical protein